MCTEHGAFPSLDSWCAGTLLNDGRVNFCWFVDIKRWIRSIVLLLLKSWLVIGRELRSLPLGFNQHLSRGKKGPFSMPCFLTRCKNTYKRRSNYLQLDPTPPF